MDGLAEKGAALGKQTQAKNDAYGDSFFKAGDFLRLLYPSGLQPSQYDDALCLVRIFDKQARIATDKEAFGESPYDDIAGYSILGSTLHDIKGRVVVRHKCINGSRNKGGTIYCSIGCCNPSTSIPHTDCVCK